jgi:hypothetical protein
MLIATSPSMKLCRDCGQDRPLEEFRLRKKNDTKRHVTCNTCHREDMRQFKAKRRGFDLNNSLGMLNSGRLRPSTVEVTLERLIRRFGSVENLVSEWVDCARQAKRGSVAALRAFGAVGQLIAIADQQRPPEPSVESLSDEDLERELMTMMADYVEGRSLLGRPGAE